MIHVIGGGGIGSWIVPKLCRLIDPHEIIIHDGDNLEVRNLDRQLFREDDIGRNKAAALADIHGTRHNANFVTANNLRPTAADWIVCCADNNAARRAALAIADRDGPRVIVAANEYEDAEAYMYSSEWQGTALDPRVYYPGLSRDNAPDPTRPHGCTGDAAAAAPQLATANDLAAALAVQLFYFWDRVAPTLPETTAPNWPVHHSASRWEIRTVDIRTKRENNQ